MNRFLEILRKVLTVIVKALTIINLVIVPIFSYFVGQELQHFRLARVLGGLALLSSLITFVLVVILALLSRDMAGRILWVIYGVVFCFYFPGLMMGWIERRFNDKPCVTAAFVLSRERASSKSSNTHFHYYYWFKDVDGKVIKDRISRSFIFDKLPKDTFLVVFNESESGHYIFEIAPTKEEIDKYIDGPKRISQEEYEKWREDYGFF